MATTTPQDRAERFRETVSRQYPYEDLRTAFLDVLRVGTDNALDALAEGREAEASVYAQLTERAHVPVSEGHLMGEAIRIDGKLYDTDEWLKRPDQADNPDRPDALPPPPAGSVLEAALRLRRAAEEQGVMADTWHDEGGPLDYPSDDWEPSNPGSWDAWAEEG